MVPQSTSTEIAHGGEPEADDSNQDPSNGNDVDKETASPIEQQNICQKSLQCLCEFYGNNDFICQVVIVILLARAYPPLGAEYLFPEITSTWIAVLFIFGESKPWMLDSFDIYVWLNLLPLSLLQFSLAWVSKQKNSPKHSSDYISIYLSKYSTWALSVPSSLV